MRGFNFPFVVFRINRLKTASEEGKRFSCFFKKAEIAFLLMSCVQYCMNKKAV